MGKRYKAPKHEAEIIDLNPSERWILVGIIGIYGLIVLWGFLSSGTWDDDCATRFFYVRHALQDPRQFISVWNRPLFTMIYVLPLQLGKEGIIFTTALVSMITCYFTYRSAKLLNYSNAFMVIPFLAFQAFYFPISFNALVEPLGAMGLALSLYFYLRKRLVLFAIIGGLLPLARLELAPLLIIWAFILIREHKLFHILLLGVPVLLWNLAGALVYSDPLWLIHRVFTGEENRYGHGSFWQYFQRYIFFTGPVIFYFFILGFLERLRQRKVDFALLVFLVGFFIYVLFSWKLSVGQAAGFMRNLLPLSPFAALLALEGYNCWLRGHRDRQINLRILAYSGAVIVLTILFFSRKLEIHHVVTNEPNYINITVILILSAIYLFKTYIIPEMAGRSATLTLLAALVIGSSGAYTMITEPPITLPPEHRVMKQVAAWYEENNLYNTMIYVNHIQFFYLGRLDLYADNFDRVTVANLDAALPGSIVIWENHYSHRLQGDVNLDYFIDNPKFKSLGQIQASGTSFVTVVFQKIES